MAWKINQSRWPGKNLLLCPNMGQPHFLCEWHLCPNRGQLFVVGMPTGIMGVYSKPVANEFKLYPVGSRCIHSDIMCMLSILCMVVGCMSPYIPRLYVSWHISSMDKGCKWLWHWCLFVYPAWPTHQSGLGHYECCQTWPQRRVNPHLRSDQVLGQAPN